jgi:hypothetical protein
LAIPRGQVGVIGTSATIDDTQARYDGDDSGGRIDMIGSVSTKLLHFASAIFEEDFTEQSVIGESREDIGRIVNKDTELEQNSTDFLARIIHQGSKCAEN